MSVHWMISLWQGPCGWRKVPPKFAPDFENSSLCLKCSKCVSLTYSRIPRPHNLCKRTDGKVQAINIALLQRHWNQFLDYWCIYLTPSPHFTDSHTMHQIRLCFGCLKTLLCSVLQVYKTFSVRLCSCSFWPIQMSDASMWCLWHQHGLWKMILPNQLLLISSRRQRVKLKFYPYW